MCADATKPKRRWRESCDRKEEEYKTREGWGVGAFQRAFPRAAAEAAAAIVIRCASLIELQVLQWPTHPLFRDRTSYVLYFDAAADLCGWKRLRENEVASRREGGAGGGYT